MTPVDPGQQIAELGGGDRHRAVGCARPQEAAPLQPLGKQACTLAVMPDHLQEIAAASTKAKQLTAQRIAPQYLLHLQRQARKALPHVRVPGRKPHPNPARKWDHGNASSPRRIRRRFSTSTSPSTRTRRPFALTISMRPQPDPDPSQAAPQRSLPAQIQPAHQAAPPDMPCATKTKADWKSRAGAPSPMPAEVLKGSPRRSESSHHRATDDAGPSQQSQDD